MKFRKGHKQDDEIKPERASVNGAGAEAGSMAGETPSQENAAAETPTVPERNEAESSGGVSADTQTEKIAALEDQLLRLRAEFANFRKRTERERSELATHVKAAVYREILPTLDDFERFFRHVEERNETLDRDFVQGIEMIHKSLAGVLQRQGIEPIQETGVPFDPNFHEAMLTGQVQDAALDHTVLQVLEPGYRLGETVIRPARVQVGVYGD
jgi:molecular chaperone GrpE